MKRNWKKYQSGFTLIELFIVIGIIAMLTSGAILGFKSLGRARLKSSAAKLVAAAQRGYSFSTTRNETVRIVIEFENNSFSIESTEGKVLIDRENLTEQDEQQQEDEEQEQAEAQEQSASSRFFSTGASSLAERIKRGFHEGEVPKYKPPKFSPIRGKYSNIELESGVKFYAVYSSLHNKEVKEGKAYIYFFPEGTADHTAIQIQGGGGQIYTVEILPSSARVKAYSYPYIPDFEQQQEEEKGKFR